MLITITALLIGVAAGYKYGQGFEDREQHKKLKQKRALLPKAYKQKAL